MAKADKDAKLREIYENRIKPSLFDIVKWKSDGQSNSYIAERLGVHPIEFQEIFESSVILQKTIKMSEKLIVDALESKIVDVAKKGNVNAIKLVLANLAPEKWGNGNDKGVPMQAPVIEVKVSDATVPQEKLDAYVQELKDKIGNLESDPVGVA